MMYVSLSLYILGVVVGAFIASPLVGFWPGITLAIVSGIVAGVVSGHEG